MHQLTCPPDLPTIDLGGPRTRVHYLPGPRPCFAHKTTHTVLVPSDLLEKVASGALPLNTRSILGSGTCAAGWEDPALKV